MTHTEESLMALADDYGREIADCPNMPTPVERKICTKKIEQARDTLRLAIREVLAERDSCAGQIAEAVDQRDRQARRAEKAENELKRVTADRDAKTTRMWELGREAEKAEAERDALAMQLKLKPAPMADCLVYCKTAVDLQAECERLCELIAELDGHEGAEGWSKGMR